MADIVLRGLDKELIDELRELAAQNHVSLNEQIRRIFKAAAKEPLPSELLRAAKADE